MVVNYGPIIITKNNLPEVGILWFWQIVEETSTFNSDLSPTTLYDWGCLRFSVVFKSARLDG